MLEYVLGAYPSRVALTFPDGAEREYVAEGGAICRGRSEGGVDAKAMVNADVK